MRTGASRRGSVSTPFLYFGPHLRQRPELRTLANENGDLLLQCIGIGGGSSHVFHVVEELVQPFPGVVQHDQAIPRVPSRAPEPISLVAAQRRRQPVPRTIKIDRPCLPVVLRKNSAARPFRG